MSRFKLTSDTGRVVLVVVVLAVGAAAGYFAGSIATFPLALQGSDSDAGRGVDLQLLWWVAGGLLVGALGAWLTLRRLDGRGLPRFSRRDPR